MSQQGPHFVHKVKLKPIIKAQVSGKLVTIGLSDDVTASEHSKKTCMKKMSMIIISTRKWFPLQGEIAPLTKNVVFTY